MVELSLDALIKSVTSAATEPLAQLDAASDTAAALGELGDSLLNHFVDRCRRSGHTWAEIGEHLGVTRQAAQKRFVASVDSVTFERFTGRARKVVDRMQHVARSLQHNYVGTEHILLALFDDEEALSRKVLDELGVARGDIERLVLDRVGRGPHPVSDEAIPLTPRSRKVLEETLRVAIELGHNYVGTEHLLLALYRGQDGLAKQFLEELGATRELVQQSVIRRLTGFKP